MGSSVGDKGWEQDRQTESTSGEAKVSVEVGDCVGLEGKW